MFSGNNGAGGFNPGSDCVIKEEEGKAICNLKHDVDEDGESEKVGEVMFVLDENNNPKARRMNFAEGFTEEEEEFMLGKSQSRVKEQLEQPGPLDGHIE